MKQSISFACTHLQITSKIQLKHIQLNGTVL